MTKNIFTYLFIDDLLDKKALSAPVSVGQLKRKLIKDLSWLTLFCYSLLIFNPVTPIISDELAHTFWLQYHLITVHSVYGNNHEDKELANSAKETSGKDKPSKSANEEYFHILPKTTYNFSFNCFVSRSYAAYRYYAPVNYPDTDYLPPKV